MVGITDQLMVSRLLIPLGLLLVKPSYTPLTTKISLITSSRHEKEDKTKAVPPRIRALFPSNECAGRTTAGLLLFSDLLSTLPC